MKYKHLTKDQLLIAFDRLTRFKNTKEKYLRVFSDIILSNLIEPVFKKSDIMSLTSEEILFYSELIINKSINAIQPNILPDYNINRLIAKYENTIFINDAFTLKLLSNNINYSAITPIINESSPINLRWLKSISNSTNLVSLRRENGLKYPIEKVLIAEGITEEILLPAFAKILNFDFYKEGIQIIPAGGKNQVVKLYYKLADELRIPIFLLLDKDAEDNIKQIEPKLRNIDKIHLVSCGEFEDLLPKSLILKTINNELTNFALINEFDWDDELSAVDNLINIFKTKGLHEFKKADFAKLVSNNITDENDISIEIKTIIEELRA